MGISKKQRQILAFPYTHYDIGIFDGAIRSGKTAFMFLAYVDWAMREFDNAWFAVCGKTVDAAKKNIINPWLVTRYAQDRYSIRWRSAEKLLIVSDGKHTNTFEVFGGKDESSFALIQGRTLAGALLDEVVLMPRSFVDQTLARCSVEGSKIWFSCNPDGPEHWFYKDFVLRAKELNALRLHFTLEDNPALSPKIVERYKRMYTGVFYDRYILGLWVMAEGLVYQTDESVYVSELPERLEKLGHWHIAIDYGTKNPFAAGLFCEFGGLAIQVDEYYYDGRKTGKPRTDEEHYRELRKLAAGRSIDYIVIDPSAASMVATIRRHRHYSVRPAKNDVIPGIALVAALLRSGALRIHRRCVSTRMEFGLYRWDEKAKEDKVVKEYDHAMDMIRYYAMTVLKRNKAIMRKVGRVADEKTEEVDH